MYADVTENTDRTNHSSENVSAVWRSVRDDRPTTTVLFGRLRADRKHPDGREIAALEGRSNHSRRLCAGAREAAPEVVTVEPVCLRAHSRNRGCPRPSTTSVRASASQERTSR